MATRKRIGGLKGTRITEKQIALVDAYFANNFNKEKAMLAVGYSPRSGRGTMTKTFGNPFVQAEIEKRMAKNRENFELNEKWVLERLMKIADGNLGRILTTLREFDWDIAALSADDQYLLTEYVDEAGRDGPRRKIKIADKIAALISLARHLGMFKDQIELSGGVSLVEKLQRGREQARLNKAAGG